MGVRVEPGGAPPLPPPPLEVLLDSSRDEQDSTAMSLRYPPPPPDRVPSPTPHSLRFPSSSTSSSFNLTNLTVHIPQPSRPPSSTRQTRPEDPPPPSRWRTKEFYLYYALFLVVVPIMWSLGARVSRGAFDCLSCVEREERRADLFFFFFFLSPVAGWVAQSRIRSIGSTNTASQRGGYSDGRLSVFFFLLPTPTAFPSSSSPSSLIPPSSPLRT